MPHTIQTNISTDSRGFHSEAAQVGAMLTRIAASHGATGLITLKATAPRASVEIRYHNGAALRDVVEALDRGGWLD